MLKLLLFISSLIMSRLSTKSSICKLINETDVFFFFYKKTDQGWREVLVDLSPEKEYVDFEGLKFLHWHVILLETCVKFPSLMEFIWNCNRSSQLRFVLAPAPTLASQTLVPQGTSVNQIEVCPQGGAIVEHMSEAIADHGGCALIVDYGEDGSRRHTLRVSW